jgi:hypothetical protein
VAVNEIGTLSETSLHAALKRWYGADGDQYEVHVDGYIIDIVRDDLLIEIQTRHLYALKRKLKKLLPHHPVHLVHPIPQEKWIVRQTATGDPIGRRRSPKHGRVIDVFNELVRIPHLLPHSHLTIQVLLTQQEEILRDDGQGSWRRRHWSVHDHRLLDVVEQFDFRSVRDYCTLLPASLPQPFTNRELAAALQCRPGLAQKMTYTLRHIGGISLVGKQGNSLLYKVELPRTE